jgi:DNA-binding transcriptional LysR family regulator
MEKAERIERRLKLHDLRVLMSVVQQGSMAKAAKHLATSQPAVSRAITDLESSVGVQLLDRGPRGVVPTPYGLALIKRGFAAFDELKQGLKDIEFLTDSTAGEVRIATSTFLASGFLAKAIDSFVLQYPRISFHVVVSGAEGLHRALEDRDVDAVITAINPLWQRESHMQREVLYTGTRSVFVAKQNRWLRRRKVALGDLINEPWVLPTTSSAMGEVYANIFRMAGCDSPRATVVEVNSLEARIALVAKGKFLTIASEADVGFANVVTVIEALPIDLSSQSEIGIMTLENRTLTPAVQLFLDCVRQTGKTARTQIRSVSSRRHS